MKANIKDKDKSGIYCIFNKINRKVYIGKAKCIFKRITQHISSLNNKVRSHENDHFINSWHKYGRDNFIYIVLEYCSIEETSVKELYFINLFKSLNSKLGYNKRYDSSTGLIVSRETRDKLSNSQILRFTKQSERDKIGIASSNFWKNNPDIKEEMSIKVADKIRKYKIAKVNYNTLEIIEIFNTRKEIKEKYPDYYTQAILGVCQGTKNSYKGFKWRYIDIKTNKIITK